MSNISRTIHIHVYAQNIYAEDGDNMTSLTKNIWKKDDRGVPKKQSLETIMAEQSLLDNVSPTPTVTKALTEDLQALVDQGIITVMEALELMPQSDEKCLSAAMETVANDPSGPQLSDDLLNMVREGLISMARRNYDAKFSCRAHHPNECF